jgi:hypothetical protein
MVAYLQISFHLTSWGTNPLTGIYRASDTGDHSPRAALDLPLANSDFTRKTSLGDNQ